MKVFVLFTTFSSALFFSQSAERPLIIKNDSITFEKLNLKSMQDSAVVKRDLMLVKKPSDSLYLSLVKKETDSEMIELPNGFNQKKVIAKSEDPKILPKK